MVEVMVGVVFGVMIGVMLGLMVGVMLGVMVGVMLGVMVGVMLGVIVGVMLGGHGWGHEVNSTILFILISLCRVEAGAKRRISRIRPFQTQWEIKKVRLKQNQSA